MFSHCILVDCPGLGMCGSYLIGDFHLPQSFSWGMGFEIGNIGSLSRSYVLCFMYRFEQFSFVP